MLYVFLRHRKRGKRDRKHAYNIRAEYRERERKENSLRGFTVHKYMHSDTCYVYDRTRSLARVYSPRLRVGKRNPRFGSTYRRQRVRPRRWEIYESDLFITLRLQSTFASSAEITEVTSRSNADSAAAKTGFTSSSSGSSSGVFRVRFQLMRKLWIFEVLIKLLRWEHTSIYANRILFSKAVLQEGYFAFESIIYKKV